MSRRRRRAPVARTNAAATRLAFVLVSPGRIRRYLNLGLAVVAAGAVVFGLIGWSTYRTAHPEESIGFWTVVYRTGALFTGDSAVPFDVPWTLEVGRLLALLALSATVLFTVAALGEDRLRRRVVGTATGHVVALGSAEALRRATAIFEVDVDKELCLFVPTGEFDVHADVVEPGFDVLTVASRQPVRGLVADVQLSAAAMVVVAAGNDAETQRVLVQLFDLYADDDSSIAAPSVRVLVDDEGTALRLAVLGAVVAPSLDLVVESADALGTEVFVDRMLSEVRGPETVCVVTGCGAASSHALVQLQEGLQGLATSGGWERCGRVVVVDPTAVPHEIDEQAFKPSVQVVPSPASGSWIPQGVPVVLGSIENHSAAGLRVQQELWLTHPAQRFVELHDPVPTVGGLRRRPDLWSQVLTGLESAGVMLSAERARCALRSLALAGWNIAPASGFPLPLRRAWYEWSARHVPELGTADDARVLVDVFGTCGIAITPPSSSPPDAEES